MAIKRCPKCNGTDFYPGGSKTRPKCRPCYSAYMKVYMAARRASGKDARYGIRGKVNRSAIKRQLLEAVGQTACQRCGFDAFAPDHLAAIDFHHRDHTTKRFPVTRHSLDRTWEELLAEAQKCDVLCANCHRIHHERHGWVRRRGSVRSD